MFLVTLGDPKHQTTPISALFVAYHIFIVIEHTDF